MAKTRSGNSHLTLWQKEKNKRKFEGEKKMPKIGFSFLQKNVCLDQHKKKGSKVSKWNGKARLFSLPIAFFERFRVQIVIFFSSFFEAARDCTFPRCCRPSMLSLPRSSLIWNFQPYPHLKLWCAETWWNWCRSKKCSKLRKQEFCCRDPFTGKLYPTPSKAYFPVYDNQANCIFTCKSHQGSTLSARKASVCVVPSFTIVTLCLW